MIFDVNGHGSIWIWLQSSISTFNAKSRAISTVMMSHWLRFPMHLEKPTQLQCIYVLPSSNSPNRYAVKLVYAKSRLAQISTATITIPRLEHLGLTIAASAAMFVRESLKLSSQIKTFLMTDAMVVLGWLQSEKQLPVFIANRVKKIMKIDNAEFHHVRGIDNPADLATRGMSGEEIRNSSFWWHGPEWLRQNIATWLTTTRFDPVAADEWNESGKAAHCDSVCILAGEGPLDTNENQRYPLGVDPKTCSSFRKLLRVTVVCLKFIKRHLWTKIQPQTGQRHPAIMKIFDPISAEVVTTSTELATAKRLWIKCMQRNHFADVFRATKNHKAHQLVKQLDVKRDHDGLLRCSGRLVYADLPFKTTQPLLLPKNDYITDLIIKQAHEKLFHSGISHTLSQLRREFWIPNGRNAVRKVISRCLLCRKSKGHPFALPPMPPWPRERIAKSILFQFSGVDYFGPVNVINGPENQTNKMWVALFTCLATRAIHLECVQNCSSTAFIDCLSRFISRRGAPEMMISDNAPQVRLAKTLFDRTWQKTLSDPPVLSYVAEKGIKWKFTTALAPWQGGCYERLVGMVKSTYKVAVGRKLLRFEEFITLMAEIEAVVNSRPLSYVCSDIKSGLALRPMDFLTSLSTGTSEVDPSAPLEGGDAAKALLRHWKYKQRRLDVMWRQFHDDYLLSLRERGRAEHRNKRSDIRSSPRVNEVVLVKNPDAPRRTWKLGKITKLIPSRDGSIRSAELLLPSGVTIERSVAHLYPLEIPTNDNHALGEELADDSSLNFDGFESKDLDAIPQHLRFLDALATSDSTVANLVLRTRSDILACLTTMAVPILL